MQFSLQRDDMESSPRKRRKRKPTVIHAELRGTKKIHGERYMKNPVVQKLKKIKRREEYSR
jgi:hypothetical protein